MFRRIIVALLLIVGVGLALPAAKNRSVRHLRFAVSDNYFFTPLPGGAEVDRSIELGVDELWIAYIHETQGVARIREQLERAGAAPGFRIYPGLGAATTTSPSRSENQYVDPYIDVSATYSPRRAPIGDFFGSTTSANTGVDEASEDVRTARLGRDAAGYLVAESYWRAGGTPNPEPYPAPVAPRSYRFRFPLRAGSNLAALPSATPVATIRIEEQDQSKVPPPLVRLVAERVVTAGDLRPAGVWHNVDVWADQEVNYSLLYDPKVWWQGAADLSVGVIEHAQWDPSTNRSMLDALDGGILRAEPRAKYGRNVFDYLDDLHADIDSHDRRLFGRLGGFWLLDEPKAPMRHAWRKVADELERYFKTKRGYRGLYPYTTFQVMVSDPASRFFKIFNPDGFLAFNVQNYRAQDYMFPPGIILESPAHEGLAYQAHIDQRVASWAYMIRRAHDAGLPFQNFLDTGLIFRSTATSLTASEVALQVYLSLALNVDSIAFWHISDLMDGSAQNLTTRGRDIRDVIGKVQPIRETYDKLDFVDAYSSPDLNGRLVTSVQDLTGRHPSDLRVQIGQFRRGADDYLMLVNRHTLDADRLDLEVSVALAEGRRSVIDVASGAILGVIESGHSSFVVTVDPGEGRLVRLARKMSKK